MKLTLILAKVYSSTLCNISFLPFIPIYVHYVPNTFLLSTGYIRRYEPVVFKVQQEGHQGYRQMRKTVVYDMGEVARPTTQQDL